MKFGLLIPLLFLVTACPKGPQVPQSIIIQDSQLSVTDTLGVSDAFLSLWYQKREQKIPPLKKWTHKINLTYGENEKPTNWLYDAQSGSLVRLNQFQKPRYVVSNRTRFNQLLQLESPESSEIDRLEELMLGSYVVVGKKLTDNSLYETVGTIERAEDGEGQFLILRGIPRDTTERIIEGVGTLTAISGDTSSYELEVHWRDSLWQGKATSLYQITIDYQNIVRFSGAVSPNNQASLIAVESWFPEQLF